MLIMSFGCLRFSREPCSLYAFLLGYLPSIFLRFFLQNLLTFICRIFLIVPHHNIKAQEKSNNFAKTIDIRIKAQYPIFTSQICES